MVEGQSFVDRMRRNPPAVRLVKVMGFDPDADTTGWACVEALLAQSAIPQRCWIGRVTPERVPGGRADLEQAQAMVDAVAEFEAPFLPLQAVFVESQRIYPTPDEDPRTRVAKANDLLRLAQVTGAVQAWGRYVGRISARMHVQAVAPATWKGQQRKEHTAVDLMKRLVLVPVHAKYELRGKTYATDMVGAELGQLPPLMGHALDALGIALWGLDWLALHPDALAAT